MLDHLGSTKLLTDNEGRIVWPRMNGTPNELLPFGKDLDFNSENPDPVESSYRLTFTNKEIDHQLDLHYFGARYYNATIPRFISPDPVSGKPAIPISWNRYLYCRNDPINYIDPDGECAIVLGVAAAVGFGFAVGYLASESSSEVGKATDGGITAAGASLNFALLSVGGGGNAAGPLRTLLAGGAGGMFTSTLAEGKDLVDSDPETTFDIENVGWGTLTGTVISGPLAIISKAPANTKRTIADTAVSIAGSLYSFVVQQLKDGSGIEEQDIQTAADRWKTRKELEQQTSTTNTNTQQSQ